ncbi:LuxR C-terminal-related transcriptional regulator [Sphingobium cupriresistens]|uniref:helix-turn-helix transcriptional regulator n=1 Tax=Sphingobium cupriresistens TaxID=1132417 RepID=UPI003BAE1393
MGVVEMLAGGALQRQFDHACVALDVSWVRHFVMEGGSVMAIGPIEDCASSVDLENWLEQFALEMGFDGARYHHIGHRPQGGRTAKRPPLRFLSTLENGQEPWRAGDPALSQIVQSFLPFVWSTKDDLSLPDLQRAWLSIERLRGVEAGVVIPVQDYLSGPAYISLFSEKLSQAISAVEQRRHEMATLAIEFHLRAKQLITIRTRSSVLLSDREFSCLRNAAAGVALAESAGSLGISVRTVETHLAKATLKLGGTNRINAVAIAIGSGMIHV